MGAKQRGAVFVVLLMLLLGGCSQGEGSPRATGDQALQDLPSMDLVSGSVEGGWIKMAAAIVSQANQSFQGYPITAMSGDAITNPYTVYLGRAQLGLSQGIFLSRAVSGAEPYETPMSNLQAIASLESRAMYFLTDRQNASETLGEMLGDLDQLHLGSLPKSDASTLAMDYVFQAYEREWNQSIELPSSRAYYGERPALSKAFTDEYIDLLVINEALPDPWLKTVMTQREAKLLSLEPEMIEALAAQYDWIPMVIPAGTYPGQSKEVRTVGIKTVLFAREDVPEPVAYELARALYENKAYLETIDDSFKALNVQELAQNLTLPIHPGAQHFYRDVGLINE